VEFSGNYVNGAFSAYGNFAISRAQGKDIISSQFNFDPGDLAFIQNHFIFLDHDQTYSASAGVAYKFGDGTRVSGDLIYGSGLRLTPDGAPPNSGHVAGYTQVNLSVAHAFEMAGGPLTIRADVINLFDKEYEIRDGTGVGVGAPQFGPRRGFYAGISKAF
jgi:outer membrane receptor protein involved in Fe transport